MDNLVLGVETEADPFATIAKDPSRWNNWNSRILDTFHSKDFRKNAENKQIANELCVKEFTHNLQLESMGTKNLPTTSGHYCY